MPDCEELVWDEIQMPVQRVIRTFLEKKHWRPERLLIGNCMDNLILNADKNADKWILLKFKIPQTLGNAGGQRWN